MLQIILMVSTKQIFESYKYNATSVSTDIIYFLIIFLISTFFYGVNVSKPLFELLNNSLFLYLLIVTQIWIVCNMS